ncbi:LuxR family two component transcriptional regulator [Streptomyces sp. T12]|uniref:response regulator transcription factor n=1 Tax=Streptomyces sp. T12 TaxID=477697 RepID=UPI0011AD1DA5|nr:response regulator transcription factor [Streptomyces sp. T12]TWD13567.1 LuxR family two component transcriptional regulator [Streptomyces sp. T12]
MSGQERLQPIRVLVVDDHAVVRQGMRAFLSLQADMRVVGEARDAQAALDFLATATVRDVMPNVVLMDLVMPRLDGVSGIRTIKKLYPGIEVVAMTSFSETERVRAALAAGAAGYLLKDAEADEVATAIRAAAAGETHLDTAVARKITRALTGVCEGVSSLSQREREVLVLVADGYSNRDIAEALTISERTARTHVSSILLKIGVTSRTQAALWAIHQGMTSVP